MAITVTATVLDDKAGVSLTATMPATYTSVTIGRQDPTGFTAMIRFGESIPVSGGTVTVEDYEAPLDKPVYYVVTQLTPTGNDTGTSNVVTVPSHGYTWIKDPSYTGRNMVIPVVTNVTGLTRAAQSGVFQILDRANPIVVSTVRAGLSATLTCHTLTRTQEQALLDILSSGNVLLLQGPPNELGNRYVAIGDVGEELVGLVTDEARVWTLPFTTVDRPAGIASPNPVDNTWRAVKTKYATWGDLTASGLTWQQLVDSGP
jgi:hypothetical protein